MNSIDGSAGLRRTAGSREPGRPGLLPVLRHPGVRDRAARLPRRRHRRLPGRRLRPGHRGDAGHRPGRRRRRPPRRLLAVRDDAGVRGRLPAGEDRHARLRRRGGHQQVRAARRARTPCATSAASWPGTASTPASPSRSSRSSAPSPAASTTTASPPSTSTSGTSSADHGLQLGPGRAACRSPGRTSTRGAGHRAPRPRSLPGRDRRHRARLPPRHRRGGRRPPAAASSCGEVAAACSPTADRPTRPPPS